MEFLRSFLTSNFAGKPVGASRNVGCFVGLKYSKLKTCFPLYRIPDSQHLHVIRQFKDMNGRFILHTYFTEKFPSIKRYFVQPHFVSEAVNQLLCPRKAYTIFSLKQQRRRVLPLRFHVTFQSTVLRFATLVTRWELEPKCVPQLFLGFVTGEAQVSYWPIFSPLPRNIPRSLCER